MKQDHSHIHHIYGVWENGNIHVFVPCWLAGQPVGPTLIITKTHTFQRVKKLWYLLWNPPTSTVLMCRCTLSLIYTCTHTSSYTIHTCTIMCTHTRTYITHNPHTNTHITYTHTSHTSYTCTSYVHTHRHTYTHTQSTSRKMILTHFLSHVEGDFFRSVNSVFTRSSSSVTHNACHIINILRCMRQ